MQKSCTIPSDKFYFAITFFILTDFFLSSSAVLMFCLWISLCVSLFTLIPLFSSRTSTGSVKNSFSFEWWNAAFLPNGSPVISSFLIPLCFFSLGSSLLVCVSSFLLTASAWSESPILIRLSLVYLSKSASSASLVSWFQKDIVRYILFLEHSIYHFDWILILCFY